MQVLSWSATPRVVESASGAAASSDSEPTSIGELISRNQELAPLVEHWLLMKLRIEGIADMREKHALSVVFGDK